jgi:hypothetical protein
MALDARPQFPPFRTAKDFTPELLTSVLRTYAPEVEVTDVRVRRTWQGTTSHLHLDVDYADAGRADLPSHLFVKTQLNTVEDLPAEYTESLSEGGGGTTLLASETTFYRELRPDINAETLRVFVSEHIPGPAQFLIVTEDVGDRGAEFPNALNGLSVEYVSELLRCLARVHAPLWNDARLSDDGDLASLDTPLQGPFADFLRSAGFQIIRAMLDIPYKTAALKTAGLDADTLERAFWRLQESLAEGPRTLLHGDPHPANTYVLPGGSVGVLDWQLVRRGSWVHDVGYAMMCALDPADRRAAEKDLLHGYLQELADAGVRELPTWEQAWTLYRSSPPWGFSMWAITPGQMYSDELVEAVLNRFAVAHADLETSAVLGL